MNERWNMVGIRKLGNVRNIEVNITEQVLPLLDDGAPPNTHASTEKRTTIRKNMIVDDKSLETNINDGDVAKVRRDQKCS